jgi:hypothetical protein
MKRAVSIQSTIERYIAEVTTKEHLLPLALARSAKRTNFALSEVEIERLTTALINSEDGKLALDLEPPCGLGATEAEIQASLQLLVDDLLATINHVIEDVSTAVSEAVPEGLAQVADLIGDRLAQCALEHAAQLRKAQAERERSVQRMWGVALDQLDFLRHIVLEWSHEASTLRSGPYGNPNTAFALGKLATRVYEVVGEIITLSRAGYADGALARWRSLHEVCVIAMFLAKRSDRCALMYLSHHQVEELRLLEVDRSSGTANMKDLHQDRYVGHLRRQKAAMVDAFGPVFANDYGWASVELGRARTTFRDLENYVGLVVLRRGYQRANSTVHGGALATLTRISLGVNRIHDGEVPPAYGCEVAANYVTASLSMMIGELCLTTENADLLAMSIVVHNHAEKVRNQISKIREDISINSPRAKILKRKAEQRKTRVKMRRTQFKP